MKFIIDLGAFRLEIFRLAQDRPVSVELWGIEKSTGAWSKVSDDQIKVDEFKRMAGILTG